MFQRNTDKLFHGLPNVFDITDDIFTTGFDELHSGYNETVNKVLKYAEKPS